MTDRELLELAAKAAGYRLRVNGTYFIEVASYSDLGQTCLKRWNPLTDDGDALRLAVKLGFLLEVNHLEENPKVIVWDCEEYRTYEYWGDTEGTTSIDPYVATRRAIVRAAAEIGKAMSERIA